MTFAAGLAAEGFRPFVAIYSTFLQRAYDQMVHDVAIQKLPVRFAIDRAGFVGADGPTHCGAFDTAFSATLPGFVVMAAADEAELRHMVRTAAAYDEGPIAFRYPRGNGVGVDMPERGDRLTSARAASSRRAARSRCCRSARGCRIAWRRPRSSTPPACRPPSPTPVSPSRSTRIWCAGWRASTRFW